MNNYAITIINVPELSSLCSPEEVSNDPRQRS